VRGSAPHALRARARTKDRRRTPTPRWQQRAAHKRRTPARRAGKSARTKQRGVGRRRKPEQRDARRGSRPHRPGTSGGALLQGTGEDKREQACTRCGPDASTGRGLMPQPPEPETRWRTAGRRWRRHGRLAPKPGAYPRSARKQKKRFSRAEVWRECRDTTARTEADESDEHGVGTHVRCGQAWHGQERLRATSAACSARHRA